MNFDPKNHNPDPAYLRGLIEKIGLSQHKIAVLLDIEPRTLRKYIANRAANNVLDCPYTVQFCLQWLAENYQNQVVNDE